MYASSAIGERLLAAAIEAVERGERGLLSALDALRAPIYVTDPEGVVTHFNRACLTLAGRTPTPGKDRWCVTWRLYTDAGEFLPHEQCPMALALRARYPVRGVSAVAERPDGSRVDFLASPTPIFDKRGTLLGAVNLLIDITDLKAIDQLRLEARRCRRLAETAEDTGAAQTLGAMALECESRAKAMDDARCAWPLAFSLMDHGGAVPAGVRVIHKLADRRLYDPQTGERLTLHGLTDLLLRGVDFVVIREDTGEDLTRSVLLQIALTQKAGGRPVLSASFLRKLARLSRDRIGGLAGVYLEFALQQFERRKGLLEALIREQDQITAPRAESSCGLR